jgi:hypothetical protein
MRALLKFWDKAALALSCVVVASVLLFGSSRAERKELLLSAGRMTRALEDDLRARMGEPLTPSAVPQPLARAFGPVIEAAPGDEWVYYARPRVGVSVTVTAPLPGTAPPKKAFRLDKPVVGGIVAETGFVRMTWDDAPGTSARVVGYLIYRRRAGEAAFGRITQEPVKEKVFTDEDVPSRQDLEYAVAAVTDDPEAAKSFGLGSGGEGPRSDPKTVRTLGLFALALRIVSRFPPDREGGEPVILARVTVRKLVSGAWVEKDYSVRKGDRIGRPETISRNGRPVAVDFATGFEVLGIEAAKAARVEKVLRPRFDPKTAQKVGEEEVTVTREVPTWKLIYRDDTGTTRVVTPEEGRAQPPAATKGEKEKTVR